ncbi:MAG TPA: type III-B CRISPR module RAMP protein Cmr6, partial [Myxococcota bacterium]|nr:type III-B CRISPR module RAMP protein Cmr6 [Myxococcota bacterium]
VTVTMRVHLPRQGVLPDELPRAGGGNAGLIHQRFLGLPLTRARGTAAKEGSDADRAIRAFLDRYASCREAGEALLRLHHARGEGAPLGGDGDTTTRWLDLTLDTRLAAGLGNVHPLENGLTFHHTLGVPYLPGTTLKGLLRAWLELTGEADLDAWFGRAPDASGRGASCGALVIHDALPTRWPALERDLINCHLPAWYRGAGNPGAVPKEDPVPASLLVVAAGATFRFRVGARRDARPELVSRALGHLRDALSMIGVGAKTAAGYGYFGASAWVPTAPEVPMNRRVLQAFLSHRSTDKAEVDRLATALTRLGIVPWLDADRLTLGEPLTTALRKAVTASGALVAVLTPESLASGWVDEELRVAINQEAQDASFRILPVLWRLDLEALRADPRLDGWFVGERLDRLITSDADPEQLAQQIARALYVRREVPGADAWAIVCDQRGDGTRVGPPSADVPGSGPVLVLRPDRGERSRGATLVGAAWDAWRGDMTRALQLADPGGRAAAGGTRRVRLHLRCQLAVALWLGARLSRQRGWTVETWDDHAKGWRPGEGDPRASDAVSLELVASGDGRVVDLFLGHPDRLGKVPLDAVAAWRQAHGADGPFAAWHGPFFPNGVALDAWARGVARQLTQLARGRAVRLFTTCPVVALVALGRELTPQVTPQLTLMEWTPSVEPGDVYQACRIFPD